jgi:hypothetical protein
MPPRGAFSFFIGKSDSNADRNVALHYSAPPPPPVKNRRSVCFPHAVVGLQHHLLIFVRSIVTISLPETILDRKRRTPVLFAG